MHMSLCLILYGGFQICIILLRLVLNSVLNLACACICTLLENMHLVGLPYMCLRICVYVHIYSKEPAYTHVHCIAS